MLFQANLPALCLPVTQRLCFISRPFRKSAATVITVTADTHNGDMAWSQAICRRPDLPRGRASVCCSSQQFAVTGTREFVFNSVRTAGSLPAGVTPSPVTKKGQLHGSPADVHPGPQVARCPCPMQGAHIPGQAAWLVSSEQTGFPHGLAGWDRRQGCPVRNPEDGTPSSGGRPASQRRRQPLCHRELRRSLAGARSALPSLPSVVRGPSPQTAFP